MLDVHADAHARCACSVCMPDVHVRRASPPIATEYAIVAVEIPAAWSLRASNVNQTCARFRIAAFAMQRNHCSGMHCIDDIRFQRAVRCGACRFQHPI
jgi:hypothetical protein